MTELAPISDLRSMLEAVLLVVDSPIDEDQLSEVTGIHAEVVNTELTAWQDELNSRGSGIELRHLHSGWRLYTRPEHAEIVERVLLDGSRTKLTRAALETLAVAAYKQPVTRAQISAVRGVNVDGVVRTLVARGLLIEVGHHEETGALLYATTDLFLEKIGITELSELPDLAPLLPDVEQIDEISDELFADVEDRIDRGRQKTQGYGVSTPGVSAPEDQ